MCGLFRETNLALTTLEALFLFHNLSYEVLHSTIGFVTFELGRTQVLGVNGAILNFTIFCIFGPLVHVPS